MLIDSHCHLNFPKLQQNLNDYLSQMAANQVTHALCVATRPDNIAQVVALANDYPQLFASVGVHPDEQLDGFNLTKEYLLSFTAEPKVIAIGETGLDYYRNKEQDFSWQQQRFQVHIDVAKQVQLPLIIHTRDAVAATWDMLYQAAAPAAVLHCFTESVAWARKFLDLGYYISLSGIVTFNNASQVQEVAKYIPLDRLLLETDAPYLAPVPYRGKCNHPALVRHTAAQVALLRQISIDDLALATTANFARLFTKARL